MLEVERVSFEDWVPPDLMPKSLINQQKMEMMNLTFAPLTSKASSVEIKYSKDFNNFMKHAILQEKPAKAAYKKNPEFMGNSEYTKGAWTIPAKYFQGPNINEAANFLMKMYFE